MNYQDEDDDMFNYDVGFGLDDPQSPLANNHSPHLMVPLRDYLPVSPSRDLGFAFSSLSIPMRDVPKAPATQARQRPIQAKTHNDRKNQHSNPMGDAGGDMSSTSSNDRMTGGGGAPSVSEVRVRLTAAQVMRLANIQNVLNQLELQQTQLGINNRDRIEELKKQQADIFLNAIDTDSQQVGGEATCLLKKH